MISIRGQRLAITLALSGLAACRLDAQGSRQPADDVPGPQLGHANSWSGTPDADPTAPANRAAPVRLTWPKNTNVALEEEAQYLHKLVLGWWATRREHERADGVSISRVFARLRSRAKAAKSPAHYAAAVRDALCSLGDGHLKLSGAGVATRIVDSGLRFTPVAEGIAVRGVDATRYASTLIGDLVETVDGEPVAEWLREHCIAPASTTAARQYVAARELGRRPLYEHEAATPKSLGLRRGDTVHRVSLQWEQPAASPSRGACVTGRMLDHRHRIGLVTIHTFWCTRSSTPDDGIFAAELEVALKATKRADHLVVDLRENSGGRDQQARAAAQSLTGERLIWMRFAHPTPYGERRPTFYVSHLEPADPPPARLFSGSLWVLIGPGCFSTCETFASALRGRANTRMVGRPTAGGVGNPTPFRLPYTGQVVSIPVSLYALPEDESQLIETRGVKPHVEVKPSAADVAAERDPELAAALAEIRRTP